MVFLHGGPGFNSYDFAVLAGPRLEPMLQMVYFDQRGSGRSERPESGDYAMTTLVNDIDLLRQTLGVPRIALVGHSFGGTLALEYAARYPEHVSRLVYVSGLWDAPAQCAHRRQRLAEVHPEEFARFVAEVEAAGSTLPGDCELEFRVLSREDREAFNDAGLYRDPASRALHDSLSTASGLSNTGEMSRALFQAGLLQYRFAQHQRLAMPVLIIVGRHDHQGGIEPQRQLAELLPKAAFLEYEDSGHFPYLDEPERFARDVTEFLKDG